MAKHCRRNKEQTYSSTPVLVATKQDCWVLVPFVFLLHFEQTYSHLLTAHYCRHLLVHYHLRCLLVCFCLMKPWLLSYTLRPFLSPPNPSLSKASIARQHYQYMWFFLVKETFFQQNTKCWKQRTRKDNNGGDVSKVLGWHH